MKRTHSIKDWIVKEENGEVHCIHLPSDRYLIFKGDLAIKYAELRSGKDIPAESLISKLFIENDLSIRELWEYEVFSSEQTYANGNYGQDLPLSPFGSFT